jgi:hypothetical protein
MTRPFSPIIAAFVATRLTHSVRPDTDSAGAVPSLPSAPAQPTSSPREQWIADEIRKAKETK